MTKTKSTKIKRWYFKEDKWLRIGLYLFVLAGLIAGIMQVWLQVNQQGEEALRAHTERLARLILSQAKHESRIWLMENNQDALQSLAQHLQQQDVILEVSIQDELGRNLVRLGHDLPIHRYLTNLPEMIWAVPMVVEVTADTTTEPQSLSFNEPLNTKIGERLGFVRITFDYDRIMAESRPFYRSIMSESAFLIVLAFFAGVMLATVFVRRRKPALIRATTEAKD